MRRRRRLPAHAIRELLSYLPQNNREDPPRRPPATTIRAARTAALDTLVPEDPNKPYDIKELIAAVVDDGDFFEVHEHYAQNIVVGFARIDGRSVGIVANQPAFLAGCLDIDSSLKGARFVRFCDAFNIPLVTFEDVPGFLPGTDQEFGGIIRHGAKLLYAYRRGDRAEDHRHHPQGLRRRLLRDVDQAHPDRREPRLAHGRDRRDGAGGGGQHRLPARAGEAGAEAPRVRAEKVDEYRESFRNPFIAAERGFVDEIIEPRQTRPEICARCGSSEPSGRACRRRSTATFPYSAVTRVVKGSPGAGSPLFLLTSVGACGKLAPPASEENSDSRDRPGLSKERT